MPVKSFQGERAQKKRVTPSKLTVSDIMQTQLILFRPEQIIHQVMQTFIKHRISGGPVVDERGTLRGIISEADCMKEISESRYFNMPIFHAAAKFSKSSRRRYPVLENGRLVGQINRKDIVIAAINMKSQTWRIK